MFCTRNDRNTHVDLVVCFHQVQTVLMIRENIFDRVGDYDNEN